MPNHQVIMGMSDKELETFLNITIAELVPGEARIQTQFYNYGVCIVADLLKHDHDTPQLGSVSYRVIGKALKRAIRAIKQGG